MQSTFGRIVTKTETINGTTTTWTYGYDVAGRLSDVLKDGAVYAHYDYDANGNRLDKTNGAGTLLAAGTYDNQDRMLTYGNNTYAYTANGELTAKTDTTTGNVTTYNYDVLGNLKHVNLPDGTAIDYVIDGRNRRIGKKVNGALTEAYLYDGQLRPVAELDASGNVVSRFIYATHVNVPDYIIKGGVTYKIITDHLGSPRFVIDSSTGAIAQRMDYDDFGNVLMDTNPGFTPFGFAGGLYDSQTKLVRFGARDYDAETGRWTSKDQLRFSGGDPELYGYVFSDPASQVDPLGLTAMTFSIGKGQLTVDPEQPGRIPYSIPATSGRGSCMNEPSCAGQKDTGPIPPGKYNADITQLSNPGFVGDVLRNMTGDWGDWRVPLTPSPGTDTLGRSGFFMHGGSEPGSAGCIDIGGGIFGNDATDKVLKDLLADPDHQVPLTVVP
jgi:RHS repeat-associated protein